MAVAAPAALTAATPAEVPDAPRGEPVEAAAVEAAAVEAAAVEAAAVEAVAVEAAAVEAARSPASDGASVASVWLSILRIRIVFSWSMGSEMMAHGCRPAPLPPPPPLPLPLPPPAANARGSTCSAYSRAAPHQMLSSPQSDPSRR